MGVDMAVDMAVDMVRPSELRGDVDPADPRVRLPVVSLLYIIDAATATCDFRLSWWFAGRFAHLAGGPLHRFGVARAADRWCRADNSSAAFGAHPTRGCQSAVSAWDDHWW